jgi:hypothetical protein
MKMNTPKGMPDVVKAGKVANVTSPGVVNGPGYAPPSSSIGGAIAHTGPDVKFSVPSHGDAPKMVGEDWSKPPAESQGGAIEHSGPAKQ